MEAGCTPAAAVRAGARGQWVSLYRSYRPELAVRRRMDFGEQTLKADVHLPAARKPALDPQQAILAAAAVMTSNCSSTARTFGMLALPAGAG